MERFYRISGMTCSSCVAKVQTALEGTPDVHSATVRLTEPQATIRATSAVALDDMAAALRSAGNYSIEPFTSSDVEELLPARSMATYRPLILIIGFITGVTILAQYPLASFSFMLWMQHFMAGFFLVFSFFKLLNIAGFASSYRMYDVVAARWQPWGYIYPFVELGLGIAYLIHFEPFLTNIVTIVVLGVSSIGVIQSNINKRKIKCACLGDVFKLPMSTVTIVEDVSMVAMAAAMLLA